MNISKITFAMTLPAVDPDDHTSGTYVRFYDAGDAQGIYVGESIDIVFRNFKAPKSHERAMWKVDEDGNNQSRSVHYTIARKWNVKAHVVLVCRVYYQHDTIFLMEEVWAHLLDAYSSSVRRHL